MCAAQWFLPKEFVGVGCGLGRAEMGFAWF